MRVLTVSNTAQVDRYGHGGPAAADDRRWMMARGQKEEGPDCSGPEHLAAGCRTGACFREEEQGGGLGPQRVQYLARNCHAPIEGLAATASTAASRWASRAV